VIQTSDPSNEVITLDLNNFAEIKYSRNMTLMVIWTCVIYIIGGLPRTVYIMIKYIMEASRYYTFSLITFSILIYSNGFSIFIYYLYNNMFKQILNDYLKRVCFFRRNLS
jgi:hypothetical protein